MHGNIVGILILGIVIAATVAFWRHRSNWIKKRHLFAGLVLLFILPFGWNAFQAHRASVSSNKVAKIYLSSGEMMWSRVFLVHQNGLVEGIESNFGNPKYARAHIGRDEFASIINRSTPLYRFVSGSADGQSRLEFGDCYSDNPHSWWLYTEWSFDDKSKKSTGFKGHCSIDFPLGIPSVVSGVLGMIGLHGEFGQPGLEIAHGVLYSSVNSKIPDSAWVPLPEGKDFRED